MNISRSILRKQIGILIGISMLPALIVAGANSPDETWGLVKIKQDLPKHVELTFSNEVRYRDRSTNFKKAVSEIQVNYGLLKHLELSLEYRFFTTPKIWGERSGGAVKYELDTGPLEHSYRLKAQREWVADRSPEKVYRHKYTLAYDGWKKLTPYIAFEGFTAPVLKADHFQKTRKSAGIDFKLTKQHKVTLFYLVQEERGDLFINDIVGFELELELKKLTR